MFYNLKLYFKIVTKSLAMQMEYSLSFVLQIISFFVLYLAQFGATCILFQRFNTIAGWTLGEVCIFYGLINVSFSISDIITQGFGNMQNLIKSGEFDRFLTKPCPILLQVLGFNFSINRIGRLFQGIVVLVIGIIEADVSMNIRNIFQILWTVLGGSSLFMGVLIVQVTLCFKTTESMEFMSLLTNGGVETAQYPISIYNATFRNIFTYIFPLACISYFPILPILGKADVLGTSYIFQCSCPIIGLIFLAIAIFIWGKGLNWYVSTGT